MSPLGIATLCVSVIALCNSVGILIVNIMQLKHAKKKDGDKNVR